jgi:hypothetical protein
MRIYVAASSRNDHQPFVVEALRSVGHIVYDSRDPGEGRREGVDLVDHAFKRNKRALEWCEVCVLVLPSGVSAHLEAGWCAGRRKSVVVYAPEMNLTEPMYKLFDLDEDYTPLFSHLYEVATHIRGLGRLMQLCAE